MTLNPSNSSNLEQLALKGLISGSAHYCYLPKGCTKRRMKMIVCCWQWQWMYFCRLSWSSKAWQATYWTRQQQAADSSVWQRGVCASDCRRKNNRYTVLQRLQCFLSFYFFSCFLIMVFFFRCHLLFRRSVCLISACLPVFCQSFNFMILVFLCPL